MVSLSDPPKNPKPALVCHHHPERDSVARCPSCGLVFCRECVVEHDGKILCASCMRNAVKSAQVPVRKKLNLGPWVLGLKFVVALFFLWFCFFGVGRMLLKMPASYHDGSVWKPDWLDE